MKEEEISHVLTIISVCISLVGNILLLYIESKQIRTFRRALKQYQQLIPREYEFFIGEEDACWPLKYRQKISMCIIFIATAEILSWLPLILTYFVPKHPGLCRIQAQMNEYFDLAGVLWTGAVTTLICLLFYACSHGLSEEKTAQRAKNIFISAQFICWGLPLLFVLICLSQDAFGRISEDWCWIVKYKWEQVAFFYGPIFVIFIGNNIGWILSYHWLKNAQGQESKDTWHLFRMFLVYSIAFVIVWGFPLAHRLGMLIRPDMPHHAARVLRLGHAAATLMQGFFNPVVFGIMRIHNHDPEQSVLLYMQGSGYGACGGGVEASSSAVPAWKRLPHLEKIASNS